MGKIVVVGSVNMDYTALVKDLPLPGETLLAKGFQMSGGGKGANQAMAAAAFSSHVKMISMLGDDLAGHALFDKMQNKGIDISCVSFCETPTGNALINVADMGKNTIVVFPGANHKLTEDVIEKHRDVIVDADIVVMQLEIPMATVKKVAEIAHNANVPILLNPAPAQKLDAELLSKVTYITPNETELLRLTNSFETQRGAQALRALGVKNVIITLGSKGCYVKTDTEEFRVESFKVDAIDTTAAGDSFSGALAAQLAVGVDLKTALKIANATGALTTTKVGAQEALPTKEEVEALLLANPKYLRD
ncbi:MAG: ribokinase [Erysipelotrichaceae bacterium]|nr:ribokinase [Erysipelotrichaceae bacterium]